MIARELHLHADTVRQAIETERFHPTPALRASITDPYLEFVRQTLQQHPRFTLAECNRQALEWRDQVAHQRRWSGDDTRTVA